MRIILAPTKLLNITNPENFQYVYLTFNQSEPILYNKQNCQSSDKEKIQIPFVQKALLHQVTRNNIRFRSSALKSRLQASILVMYRDCSDLGGLTVFRDTAN